MCNIRPPEPFPDGQSKQCSTCSVDLSNPDSYLNKGIHDDCPEVSVVYVKTRKVGYLIGHHGRTIWGFENSSGAKIDILLPNSIDDETPVRIAGSYKCVRLALRMILDLFSLTNFSSRNWRDVSSVVDMDCSGPLPFSSYSAIPKSIKGSDGGGNNIIANEQIIVTNDDAFTLREMKITTKIASQTGCKIIAHPTSEDDSCNTMSINVIGTAEANAQAIQLILANLKPSSPPLPPPPPSQHRQSKPQQQEVTKQQPQDGDTDSVTVLSDGELMENDVLLADTEPLSPDEDEEEPSAQPSKDAVKAAVDEDDFSVISAPPADALFSALRTQRSGRKRSRTESEISSNSNTTAKSSSSFNTASGDTSLMTSPSVPLTPSSANDVNKNRMFTDKIKMNSFHLACMSLQPLCYKYRVRMQVEELAINNKNRSNADNKQYSFSSNPCIDQVITITGPEASVSGAKFELMAAAESSLNRKASNSSRVTRKFKY